MKIYTKTGDKGKTSLFDGTRVLKDNIRVDTYGTIDELNAIIGLIITEIKDKRLKIKDILLTIQSDLFTIGAELANPQIVIARSEERTTKQSRKETDKTMRLPHQPADWFAMTKLEKRILEFEKSIDEMTEELPELTNFILPGGGKTGALLQLARTVCRRAERRIITLSQQETIDYSIIKYFNRLSDLFFTMSRYVNYKEGIKETIWRK